MTFAMVECSDGEWRPAMGGKRWTDDSLVWVFADGKYRDRGESNSRPLVVIDPEDRDAVERLVRLFWAHGTDDSNDPIAMHAALRKFANPKPPKPDEPRLLGAVVEDADGNRWVRTLDGGDDDEWIAGFPSDPTLVSYNDIDAVKVISPGVPE